MIQTQHDPSSEEMVRNIDTVTGGNNSHALLCLFTVAAQGTDSRAQPHRAVGSSTS